VAVALNHTIILTHDKDRAAGFLADVLGLPEPKAAYGFFVAVRLANDVTLLYEATDREITSQHYAFLVTEAEFDQALARLRAGQLEIWADPAKTAPGEINTNNGGRGVYFHDPDGHFLEVITRPYSGLA
jgi:catechol 2,3-dioxygenase-like lactoylglutathione lyase family enzyme